MLIRRDMTEGEALRRKTDQVVAQRYTSQGEQYANRI